MDRVRGPRVEALRLALLHLLDLADRFEARDTSITQGELNLLQSITSAALSSITNETARLVVAESAVLTDVVRRATTRIRSEAEPNRNELLEWLARAFDGLGYMPSDELLASLLPDIAAIKKAGGSARTAWERAGKAFGKSYRTMLERSSPEALHEARQFLYRREGSRRLGVRRYVGRLVDAPVLQGEAEGLVRGLERGVRNPASSWEQPAKFEPYEGPDFSAPDEPSAADDGEDSDPPKPGVF
ncbi:MAG: hypothetical protein EPO40_02150 [Myxococcaceae bacterium]|nr:MAG: hypothetical protein EPO40_02150 [Myxococcaceae bacterium]